MKVSTIDRQILPAEWFIDKNRSAEDNSGPHILIVDNFYDDPDRVRALALDQQYVQYSPPLAEQVGQEKAGSAEFVTAESVWRTTALLRFRGEPVRKPVAGYRYNDNDVRCKLERVIDSKISTKNWEFTGDGWNGAFHLRSSGRAPVSIHHHYKAGDLETKSWSGLVYLSPDAIAGSGTSIWRDSATGKCVASFGALFSRRLEQFERVFMVENKYNRLLLFRENVLHRAEDGFGKAKQSRLTQTFFFNVATN